MTLSTHHLSLLVPALLLFSGCGQWGGGATSEDQSEVDRYRDSPSEEATASLAKSSFEDITLLEQYDGANVRRAWRVFAEVSEEFFRVYAALPCEFNPMRFCYSREDQEPLLEIDIVEHIDPPGKAEEWCSTELGRAPCGEDRLWYQRELVVLSKRPEAIRQSEVLAPCQKSFIEGEVVSLTANRLDGDREVEDITLEVRYLCEGDASPIRRELVLSTR